jgi:hypothetical protein
MIEFKGKLMTVKCDCCGKQTVAPTCIGVVELSGKGWNMFKRNSKDELVQSCNECCDADFANVEAKASVKIIEPVFVCVV